LEKLQIGLYFLVKLVLLVTFKLKFWIKKKYALNG
jgi:hypothetical protein